ncbi:MAG: hypothetical protein LBW85_06590 [Deltaproteobacteria bacterium]|jgi:hypothetical protein|nr:hypothetical protein [Deltaproteobacteria bacterium]
MNIKGRRRRKSRQDNPEADPPVARRVLLLAGKSGEAAPAFLSDSGDGSDSGIVIAALFRGRHQAPRETDSILSIDAANGQQTG